LNKRSILTLVIVLAVIVALVLVKQLSWSTKGFVEEMGLVPLAPDDFLVSKVTRLEIFSGGKPDDKIVLSKNDDRWIIASRFDAPADTEKITSLLKKLKDLHGQTRVSDPSVLGDFDLTDDRALHYAIYLGGEQPALHLLAGKKIDWKTAFVRADGDNTVYEVALNLRSEAGFYGNDATQPPEAKKWLDTTIVDIDKDKAVKLAFRWPDKQLVFERPLKAEQEPQEGEKAGTDADEAETGKKDGTAETKEPPKREWQLASGGPGAAFDKEALNTMLEALSSLNADDVADPAEKEDWGLAAPIWAAEVELEDGTKTTLLAGRPDPSDDAYVMLANTSTVYKVTKWNFEKVFAKTGDLFDLAGLDVNQDDIQKIGLKLPRKQLAFTFARDDEGNWQHTTPQPEGRTWFDINDTAVQDLAQAIANWTPADYADGQDWTAYGLDPKTNAITVAMKDGSTHSLVLGAKSKCIDGRYALIDDRKLVVVAKQMDLGDLVPTLTTLFDPVVLDLDRDTVTSIEFTGRDKSFKLVKNDKGWQVETAGKLLPADQEAVDNLLGALSPLEGDDFLAALPDFAVSTTLKIDTPEGGPYVLQLGDGQRARLPGKALDIRISPGDLDTLTPDPGTLAKEQPKPAPAEPEKKATQAEPKDTSAEEKQAPAAKP